MATRKSSATAPAFDERPEAIAAFAAALSDNALIELGAAIREEVTRRARSAGDQDAILDAAFNRGFARDGLGVLPWIEPPFVVCPGGLVAKNRANHRCQFVSVDDRWVWESADLIREDKRSVGAADEGFRAIARCRSSRAWRSTSCARACGRASTASNASPAWSCAAVAWSRSNGVRWRRGSCAEAIATGAACHAPGATTFVDCASLERNTMHTRPVLSAFATLALLCFAPTVVAQERAAPKKVPTFPEAVEAAKKAVEAEKLGAAIAALQAAIRDLQKKQRTAVLACLPKPEGWKIEDPAVDEQSADLAASMMFVGATVTRHYTKGEQSIHVEVTANSPLVQMLTVVLNNPTLIEADGGELVKYGAHRAILKKSGETGQELTVVMHDIHLIKITAEGVSADDLLKVFDQACIDRLEKPLGK